MWPVLCVGGNPHRGDGVTPSVTLSVHVNPSTPSNPPSGPPSYGPSRPTCWPGSGRSTTFRPGSAAASGGGGSTAVASVQLRPSTVWLSLPLLQRLQAFFAPLTSLPEKLAQQSRYDSLVHRHTVVVVLVIQRLGDHGTACVHM